MNTVDEALMIREHHLISTNQILEKSKIMFSTLSLNVINLGQEKIQFIQRSRKGNSLLKNKIYNFMKHLHMEEC